MAMESIENIMISNSEKCKFADTEISELEQLVESFNRQQIHQSNESISGSVNTINSSRNDQYKENGRQKMLKLKQELVVEFKIYRANERSSQSEVYSAETW